MTHSKNYIQKTHKKSHINQKTTKKNFERKKNKKKRTQKRKFSRGGAYENDPDTKMLDFMKLGMGFRNRDIPPMPQPPSCAIL